MELTAENMMPIPIDDLVNGVKTPCDLYVRLNQDKFILVANAGTTTNVQQLSNYHSKSVDYLWVIKKEYYKMVHQTTTLAGVILNRKDIDAGPKTQILTKAASTVFRQVENLGLDVNSYNTARQVSEAVLTMAEHHRGLSTLLESLQKCSDAILAHSMAVSLLSSLVGQEMKFEKKATLEKLALAGLLHDVGLKALPAALAQKSALEMTSEETQLWQTHSFRGMQMLQAVGIVPDDVISMVYEHHENAIGQGFPQMIRDIKMHPLAKITALVDQFIDLTLPAPGTQPAKSAREALVYIESTMALPFNKDVFRALKRIVENESKNKAA